MKKDIYDGFEGKTLSNLWEKKRFKEGAIEIQSDVVKKGKGALKITIHTGDVAETSKGCKTSERDEVREAEHLWTKEGESYSYCFSMFIRKDFPIVPTRLVVAQWKHHDEDDNAIVDNPIIALRYNSNQLRITLQTTKEKQNLFRTNEEIKGKWIDFKFNIKFSRGKTGFLKVWMNKKKIIDYKGPTAYPKKYNYVKPGRFHFRFGLYRDKMKQPMTIYFDEYRKKKLK